MLRTCGRYCCGLTVGWVQLSNLLAPYSRVREASKTSKKLNSGLYQTSKFVRWFWVSLFPSTLSTDYEFNAVSILLVWKQLLTRKHTAKLKEIEAAVSAKPSACLSKEEVRLSEPTSGRVQKRRENCCAEIGGRTIFFIVINVSQRIFLDKNQCSQTYQPKHAESLNSS